MTANPPRAHKPIQVHLDRFDRSLLEDVATRTGLSRAESLRLGLRLAPHPFSANTSPVPPSSTS